MILDRFPGFGLAALVRQCSVTDRFCGEGSPPIASNRTQANERLLFAVGQSV